MIYKGYKIEKTSNALWGGSPESVCWNVNKDGKNIRFDTLREAKQWINAKIINQ